MFVYASILRLSPITYNRIHIMLYKKSCIFFSETVIVDKSVRGSVSPTGVCRANFCHTSMFLPNVTKCSMYVKVITVDHLNYVCLGKYIMCAVVTGNSMSYTLYKNPVQVVRMGSR